MHSLGRAPEKKCEKTKEKSAVFALDLGQRKREKKKIITLSCRFAGFGRLDCCWGKKCQCVVAMPTI